MEPRLTVPLRRIAPCSTVQAAWCADSHPPPRNPQRPEVLRRGVRLCCWCAAQAASVLGGAAAAPASESHSMVKLVSFDVDGTLIHSVGDSANKVHRQAFKGAFKQVFDVDTDIDVINHHGCTDPLILLKILEHHGVAKEESMPRLGEMQTSMLQYFETHKDEVADGVAVLPGVKNVLQELKTRSDVATCLVTGNLEPIGWGKMEAVGLLDFFSPSPFGGFGSDFCSGNTEESWRDRAELIRIAATRASHLLPNPVSERFHIGDTPMDLLAAKEAGAVAIGVTTGTYSRRDLETCGAETVVLDDLADVSQVLKAMGLE